MKRKPKKKRETKWKIKKRNGYWRLIPPGHKAAVYSCRGFETAQKKFPEVIKIFPFPSHSE